MAPRFGALRTDAKSLDGFRWVKNFLTLLDQNTLLCSDEHIAVFTHANLFL
jgi:hypothetical protein